MQNDTKTMKKSKKIQKNTLEKIGFIACAILTLVAVVAALWAISVYGGGIAWGNLERF